MPTHAPLYLGCPIWSNKAWVGELFSADAKPAEFLRQYSSVFNTVEGNTTFYGLPTEATVARWRAETPPGFRFAFKFPRAISHDKRLEGAERETEYLFELFAPLADRMGPLFLQLPPSFGPESLPALESYLAALPEGFDYAVEVRHPAFTDGGPGEETLDALLAAREADRVIFDARPLRAAPPDDAETREAQRKKPDLPVRVVVTGRHPFLRYIAHPVEAENEPWLAAWAEVVAGWLRAGLVPFCFFHAPDDFYAPHHARRFHALLSALHPLPPLPSWPAEAGGEQLALF